MVLILHIVVKLIVSFGLTVKAETIHSVSCTRCVNYAGYNSLGTQGTM